MAMDGEVTYADLALKPGKRRRNLGSLPQPGTSGRPRWHRTALWASWTGNLLLGVAVVAMGYLLLYQQSENSGCCRNMSGNVGDGNTTLENVRLELRKALCWSEPQEDKRCTLCPMKWTLCGTKCYWVSHGLKYWNSSQEDCVNQGAELLMLENQEELDFISKIIKKTTDYFWIGLSAREGWTWLNSSRLDQSRFQKRPQNEGGSCGAIRDGSIRSTDCSSNLPWVCQKEATQL